MNAVLLYVVLVLHVLMHSSPMRFSLICHGEDFLGVFIIRLFIEFDIL
jgi:hypothetical protein